MYLYKKECPLGLKYLGVTTENNPYNYKGSGKYWKNHLKFHKFKSTDIATDILLETNDLNELSFWGMYYSKIWNIVESEEWANLMEERGLDNFITKGFCKESMKNTWKNNPEIFNNSKKYWFKKGEIKESSRKTLFKKDEVGYWKNKKRPIDTINKIIKTKIEKYGTLEVNHPNSIKTRFKKGEVNSKTIKVLDIKSNIIYNSISDAARSINMSPSDLARKLAGNRKNNTNFIKI